MNLTNASTVASAIAAVVGSGVAVAALVLQLRKLPSEREAAAREMTAVPTKEIINEPRRVPDQANDTVDKRAAKTRRLIWPRRAIISVASGVAAGLIVLLIASVQSPGPTVSLTSPTPGTAVSRTKVFSATGTFSHLGSNDTIWLTDYDGGYAVDDEATLNTNGTWMASDSNVGNPGKSLPFALTLRVILADAECATKLQETMNSNGDYLTALPGGCTVADAVAVKVTTP